MTIIDIPFRLVLTVNNRGRLFYVRNFSCGFDKGASTTFDFLMGSKTYRTGSTEFNYVVQISMRRKNVGVTTRRTFVYVFRSCPVSRGRRRLVAEVHVEFQYIPHILFFQFSLCSFCPPFILICCGVPRVKEPIGICKRCRRVNCQTGLCIHIVSWKLSALLYHWISSLFHRSSFFNWRCARTCSGAPTFRISPISFIADVATGLPVLKFDREIIYSDINNLFMPDSKSSVFLLLIKPTVKSRTWKILHYFIIDLYFL